MSNVKLDIDQLNAVDLAARTKTIVGAMASHAANFPTPNPTLTNLDAAADDVLGLYTLQKQKEAAAVSATQDTETAMTTLRDMLRDEGRYVQTASGGVAATILNAGLEVEKDREPAPAVPAPGGLNGSYGDDPGEIDLQWDPLPSRRYYTIEVADAVGGPWRHVGNATKSKFTVTGLLSGQLYFLRVRGENPAGPGPFCNPISQRAS